MPEAIWRIWSAVARWPEWNRGLDRAELTGPFAVGGRITMFQSGQEPIELSIADAVEPEIFVDEADFGGVTVRTTHRVEPVDGNRARVTYAMEITGPEADTLGPQIGPEASSDFSEVLAALVERAERA
jgi:hypothetical protein